MRNSNLPIWGQQYLAKNNCIFFVRNLDASTRTVFFSCRSTAVVCFADSVSGVMGAKVIRRFALFDSDDRILLELLDPIDRDENDTVRFNRFSLSGGEIEASKRK